MGDTVQNECNVITIFPMVIECMGINPSTPTASDGQMSVSITGGTPPYTIIWSNGNVSPAINNLSVGEYSVTVIDYYGDFSAETSCTLSTVLDCDFGVYVQNFTVEPTPTPTLTPTPTSIPFVPGGFTFDADYIVLTYAFTDGIDLDTRTKVTVPDIGQTTLTDSIGWCCSEQWPADGTPILTWGGDNTGTGFESVLIDLIEFKTQYPGQNIITINSKAFWYGELGTNPVTIRVTLYKGGTMIADPENYTFYNNTFTSAYGALSPGSTVTTNLSECIEGENITSLQYNLITFNGVFL